VAFYAVAMMKLSREPLALPKVDYEDVSEVKATIIVNDSFSILYLKAIRSLYGTDASQNCLLAPLHLP